MAGEPHLADPQRFYIRPATKTDVPSITEVFLRSFNARFWQYLWPDKPIYRQWLDDAWSLGLNNPTDRTFVVEDTENDNQIVAFSRWMVPRNDGNQERKWPELSADEYDMDVCGSFFGGMEENRVELMGKRPHWFLEMLATHEDYQRRGIAARLIKWGTDQADKEGLETYLDGSEKGQPYYKRWHNFKFGKAIAIPDRPQYGSFQYIYNAAIIDTFGDTFEKHFYSAKACSDILIFLEQVHAARMAYSLMSLTDQQENVWNYVLSNKNGKAQRECPQHATAVKQGGMLQPKSQCQARNDKILGQKRLQAAWSVHNRSITKVLYKIHFASYALTPI